MHHKKVLLISRTTRLHDRMRELSHELDISVLLATPDTFGQAITSTADFGLVTLDLAGAYGHGPSADRLADVAAVIFAGLASRAVARRVSRVLPGLGWLARGAVAYAGTAAIGWALVCRHEAQDFVERGRLQPPVWVTAVFHHGKHVNEGHISH